MSDLGEELGSGSDGAESVEPTLEARLRRLDQIVAALEGGEVDLEKGLALFEEGIRHIRESEKLISQAELRIEELFGQGDDLGLRPMDDRAG